MANMFVIPDTSVDVPYDGKNVHVSLIPNPSHLEVGIVWGFFWLAFAFLNILTVCFLNEVLSCPI